MGAYVAAFDQLRLTDADEAGERRLLLEHARAHGG